MFCLPRMFRAIENRNYRLYFSDNWFPYWELASVGRPRCHDDDRRSRTGGDFHRSLIPLVPRQNGSGCGAARQVHRRD